MQTQPSTYTSRIQHTYIHTYNVLQQKRIRLRYGDSYASMHTHNYITCMLTSHTYIHTFHSKGVNFFDTGDSYGTGKLEGQRSVRITISEFVYTWPLYDMCLCVYRFVCTQGRFQVAEAWCTYVFHCVRMYVSSSNNMENRDFGTCMYVCVYVYIHIPLCTSANISVR